MLEEYYKIHLAFILWLFFSVRLHHYTGYYENEVIGRSLYQFCHPSDLDNIKVIHSTRKFAR